MIFSTCNFHNETTIYKKNKKNFVITHEFTFNYYWINCDLINRIGPNFRQLKLKKVFRFIFVITIMYKCKTLAIFESIKIFLFMIKELLSYF